MRQPSIQHLIKRFFGALTSRRLTPIEQDWVNGVLRADLAVVFWQQPAIDQRHSYEVARRTEAVLGDDSSALTAALVHDIGKRHSRAGVVGRALATAMDMLRLQLPADWQRYRDHERIGSTELADLGADKLAVAFASGRRPNLDEIDEYVWETLVAADDA